MAPEKNSNPHTDFSMQNKSIVSVVLVDPVRRLVEVTSTSNGREVLKLAGEGAGFEGEGSFSLPPGGTGWLAKVNRSAGEAYIEHFIDPGSFFVANEQIFNTMASGGRERDSYDSLTGTEKDYRTYSVDDKNHRKNFRNNKFFDLVGGDHGFRGPEGNFMGILRGGVNILGTSALNQIMQFLEDDLLRVVNRNFQHFTDWGVISMENKEGETLLTIKGNSGQNPKYDTRKETYEFELQMGACTKIKEKEYWLVMTYHTKNDTTLTLTIDRAGSISLFGPKDCWVDIDEDWGNTIGRNYGVFAGKTIKMDAGKVVDIAVGDTVTEQAFPSEIQLAEVGEHVKITENKIEIGRLTNMPRMLNLVQQPHLPDKYNPFVKDVIKVMLKPDKILGVPMAARTDPAAVADMAIRLDSINRTTNTFAN